MLTPRFEGGGVSGQRQDLPGKSLGLWSPKSLLDALTLVCFPQNWHPPATLIPCLNVELILGWWRGSQGCGAEESGDGSSVVGCVVYAH